MALLPVGLISSSGNAIIDAGSNFVVILGRAAVGWPDLIPITRITEKEFRERRQKTAPQQLKEYLDRQELNKDLAEKAWLSLDPLSRLEIEIKYANDDKAEALAEYDRTQDMRYMRLAQRIHAHIEQLQTQYYRLQISAETTAKKNSATSIKRGIITRRGLLD